MIREMLSRDAKDRPSFDRILTNYRGSIFPEYFYTFFKDYIISLSEPPNQSSAGGFLQQSALQPGNKIDRLLSEWDSLSIHLEDSGKEKRDGTLGILFV
jgi:phosphoinositide-3-kinase regulatory subunit 4